VPAQLAGREIVDTDVANLSFAFQFGPWWSAFSTLRWLGHESDTIRSRPPAVAAGSLPLSRHRSSFIQRIFRSRRARSKSRAHLVTRMARGPIFQRAGATTSSNGPPITCVRINPVDTGSSAAIIGSNGIVVFCGPHPNAHPRANGPAPLPIWGYLHVASNPLLVTSENRFSVGAGLFLPTTD